MKQPIKTLLDSTTRTWFGTKSVWIIFIAALLPFIFSAAWVSTHKADVAVGPLRAGPGMEVQEGNFLGEIGENVTFSARIWNNGSEPTGPFNVSLQVAAPDPQRDNRLRVFRPDTDQRQVRVDDMAPGDTREVEFSWDVRLVRIPDEQQITFAARVVTVVDADPPSSESPSGDVPEFEELNNQRTRPLLIRVPQPDPAQGPSAPANLTGTGTVNRTADAAVDLSVTPTEPGPEENVTVDATFANDGPDDLVNATLTLQVGQQRQTGQFSTIGGLEETRSVNITAGNTTSITEVWSPRRPGQYWARAFVEVDEEQDPNGTDNHARSGIAVQPVEITEFTEDDPPEEATLKGFYRDGIMRTITLAILLPFIALFYAGGVVRDEEREGTLTYLLTRPVKRWLFPVTKFTSGYAVSATVVGLGVAAAYVVAFSVPTTSAGNIGFLSTSLLISLAALFVYGGFFLLLGTLVDRPYLVGVGFVLGWEQIARGLVPFARDLTILHNLLTVLDDWPMDEGLLLWPQGDGAMLLVYLLVAGVAFVALASVVMTYREFDV